MTVQLSVEQERYVQALLSEGLYSSEDEIIDDALRSLQDRDDQARLTALRREIAIGIEQADRGELGEFDPHATLSRVLRRVSHDRSPAISPRLSGDIV